MNISTTSYVGLFKSAPQLFGPERFELLNQQRARFQEELVEFLGAGDLISNVSVCKETPPKSVVELLGNRSPFAETRLTDYILISADVEVDVDLLRQINKKDDLGNFPDYCAAIELSEAAEEALVLSELSAPGCISAIGGIAIANEAINFIEAKTAFSALINPLDDDPNWPELAQLELCRCLTWAREVGYGKEAFAKSRLGRSLAALTHVVGLSQYRDGEVLFRAMQGLEAFYCDGTGDLRRQLSEKIRMWVGPWADKRNIIGHLYDVRSAFVHGSAHLEYFGQRQDAWRENPELKHKTDFATTFAVRLLVRTLQKCIEQNLHEIAWGYRLETRG